MSPANMDLCLTESLDTATAVLTSSGAYYRETPDSDTWVLLKSGAPFTTGDVTDIIARESHILYRPTPDHAKSD